MEPALFARFAPLSALILAACSQTAAQTASTDQVAQASASSDIVRFSTECEKWDDWNKPAKPFRIHGSTYYVGTCGIAAILVAGDEGHVLLDTGTREGAEVVHANIKALGFDPADVELILHSHEHFDHVGGFAFMARETGAHVIASKRAAIVIFTGFDREDDPQFGMHEPMEGVMPKRNIENGESEVLGNLKLTAYETPGHTAGALAWAWDSCEDSVCRTIVYADSMSPVSRDDYKFSDHPRYLANYREGIARVRALDCDILLTPHPSHSRMIERAATGTFEGGITCQEYADGKTRDLDARLGREAGGDQ